MFWNQVNLSVLFLKRRPKLYLNNSWFPPSDFYAFCLQLLSIPKLGVAVEMLIEVATKTVKHDYLFLPSAVKGIFYSFLLFPSSQLVLGKYSIWGQKAFCQANRNDFLKSFPKDDRVRWERACFQNEREFLTWENSSGKLVGGVEKEYITFLSE